MGAVVCVVVFVWIVSFEEVVVDSIGVELVVGNIVVDVGCVVLFETIV